MCENTEKIIWSSWETTHTHTYTHSTDIFLCVKLQNTTKGLLTKRQMSWVTQIDRFGKEQKKKENVPTICWQVNFSLVCVKLPLTAPPTPLLELGHLLSVWGRSWSFMNGKARTWLAADATRGDGQWWKTAGKLKPRWRRRQRCWFSRSCRIKCICVCVCMYIFLDPTMCQL